VDEQRVGINIAHPPPSQPPAQSRARFSLGTLGRGLASLWDEVVCAVANLRRGLRRNQMADFPVILMDHAISERAPLVPWYYAYVPGIKLPLSLEYLHTALYRIAGDPDVRGVLFLMKGPSISLAQAQSMVALFARFRAWDNQFRPAGAPPKRIIVHLEQAGAAVYLIAAAADMVTTTPLSSWDVLGLRVAPTYWRETLRRVGVEFDVVKVAPWKTAADRFIREDMSEAERDQTNWLLDSLIEDIAAGIAAGRHLALEQVRALIDHAPLSADEALAAGLIDAIVYEDQLPKLLSQPDAPDAPARLKPYAQVRGLLLHRPHTHARARVGVLSLRGTIVVGDSRSFPLPLPIVGDDMMGSNTVEQTIRAARQDERLAAVVVYVDSGGGSALASDLIWRELALLNEEKPVIVYMGDVAASGGYYIATPGRRIIAQSATLTGSIGVVIAKAVTQDLYAKIGANREVIRRGDNAGINDDLAPWSPAQRARIEEMIATVYGTFKQRVADGRKLPYATLDEIANGRVWTGKQALAHGLVDELGDFDTALLAACRAAGLPTDGSVRTVPVTSPNRRLMAEPVQPAQGAWQQAGSPANAQAMAAWVSALVGGEWLQRVTQDPVWLIAPDLPRTE
jgi:protease-4